MARYFDVVSQADLRLLPPGVRDHPDLQTVAEATEDDVIDQFTVRTDQGPTYAHSSRLFARERIDHNELRDAVQVAEGEYVCLRGYAVDADRADQVLRVRLARVIAGVIRWRVAQWIREPGVSYVGSTQTQAGKTWRSNADDAFPTSWSAPLSRWDVRPPHTCL